MFFGLVTWVMTLSLHLEFPEPIIIAGYTFFHAFYRGVLALLYIQWFASDNFCVTRRDLLAIKAATPHIDSTLGSLDYHLRKNIYIRRLGYIQNDTFKACPEGTWELKAGKAVMIYVPFPSKVLSTYLLFVSPILLQFTFRDSYSIASVACDIYYFLAACLVNKAAELNRENLKISLVSAIEKGSVGRNQDHHIWG